MRIPDTLPELAIVRVLSAGGPFRVGETISIAFANPTVGRLVAHDAVPASDGQFEDAIVPETISALVTHAAGPYRASDVLTLSFIDPSVARIYSRLERSSEPSGVTTSGHQVPAVKAPSASASAQSVQPSSAPAHSDAIESADAPGPEPAATTWAISRPTSDAMEGEADATSIFETLQSARMRNDALSPGEPVPDSHSLRPPEDLSAPFFESRPVVVRCWESMEAANSEPTPLPPEEHVAVWAQRREPSDAFDDRHDDGDGQQVINRLNIDAAGAREEPAQEAPQTANVATSLAGVRVRLEWSGDRVRRFIQVVDKLFTVGRLGWYRHALAMRLLIPDAVSCGDELGDMEAMRHLHALRAAAVETLGRPLLAAFMPNFAVSTEWLATIDSPIAARALAGLRDALTPYVEDEVVIGAIDPAWTVGAVERRELLGASATSVEALLPVLIPTQSANDRLSERLAEYRRMLIDVFGQTSRSAETVRVNQMAQPNHALDDRLWQLVGAVGEAFDGLAVA